MKNVHKIRGKREFLFDDRELIILGGGALIICVLIFVLGFLVGQGLQEKSVASPLDSEDYMANEEFASVEGDMIDSGNTESRSEEVPNKGEKSKLSYYQVLPDAETYVEVETTPVKKPEAPVAPSEEAQPEETEPDAPQQDANKEAPSQSPAPAPRQDSAVAPALPNVPKSPTDAMQVGRQTYRPEENPAFTGMVYSVQVASSPDREDSERLQQKYTDLGYEAYVMTADLAEKGIWYRVRVGNLATSEEANQLRQEILNNAAHLANSPFVINVTE